jgi:exopolysaccharide production protein ExoQ
MPVMNVLNSAQPALTIARVLHRPTAAESLLIGTTIAVFTTTIPDVIMQAVTGGYTKIGWPVLGILYVLMAYIALRHSRRTLAHLRRATLLIALMLWALASVAWSLSPRATAFQAIALIGSTGLGFAMASAMPPIRAIRVTAIAITAATIGSLFAVFALPDIGIDPSGEWAGSWRGLYDQKNELGLSSALGAVFAGLWLTHGTAPERALALGALVLNMALLVLAQSTTSLLTFAVMLCVLLMPFRLLRLVGIAFPLCIILAFAIVILAPGLVADYLEVIVRSLGKDATFSNRIPIWTFLWPYIHEHFWLGFGYGAFWDDDVLPKIWFARTLKFTPTTAHNGLVEVWLGLGAVGVMLALLFIATLVGRSIRYLNRNRRDPLGRLAIAMIVMLILINAMESSFLERNDRLWCLAVWLYLALGQAPDLAGSAASRISPAASRAVTT